MSGAHRSTTQNSAVSVRKSAVWLLQLAGAAAGILVELALVVFVGYTLITQPSRAWPLPIAVAVGIIACIGVLGDIVWRRMQRATKRS
ncbi:MAG: hypothetical protein JWM19_1154 [Actinomycetia bacterium]|nr:hypothetical protein [Actinomycetes bacterium]